MSFLEGPLLYHKMAGNFFLIDVDECSLDLHDCNQTCVDTHGSFNCTCVEGYLSEDSGRNCAGMYVHVECFLNQILSS